MFLGVTQPERSARPEAGLAGQERFVDADRKYI